MKLKNILNLGYRTIVTSIMVIFSVTACGNEENSETRPATGGTFKLTFDGEDCSLKGKIITVPANGGIYTLVVEASENVEWSVTTEEETGSGFATVTPEGTQNGNGNIEIKISKKNEGESGRKASVYVTNTANKIKVGFTFEQNDKKMLIPPEYNFTHEQFMNNDKSIDYGVDYSLEGPNTIIIWHKQYGKNPEGGPYPFVPEEVLAQAEFSYNFIIDELGFANRTTSCATRYKQIIVITATLSGGAVGFGRQFNQIDGKGQGDGVGILHLCHNHTQLKPGQVTGVMHHELCHCFQYIAHYDNGNQTYGWSGAPYEMTSQWAGLNLYRYYGLDKYIWEENHMRSYFKNTHKAFMHDDNMYHDPFSLAFWDWKHEKAVSRMWKGIIADDKQDPVVTYKRQNNLTQKQFNDEMFEAACRLLTFDLPCFGKQYEKYIGTFTYDLDGAGGTYKPTVQACPQSYGFNGIRLTVPKAGTEVKATFMGSIALAPSSGKYNVVNPGNKGWRWGFVAMKNDETRVYGDVQREERGSVSFVVPEGTTFLWFVVMGAPSQHVKQDRKDGNNWPYQVQINGTTLCESTAFPES